MNNLMRSTQLWIKIWPRKPDYFFVRTLNGILIHVIVVKAIGKCINLKIDLKVFNNLHLSWKPTAVPWLFKELKKWHIMHTAWTGPFRPWYLHSFLEFLLFTYKCFVEFSNPSVALFISPVLVLSKIWLTLNFFWWSICSSGQDDIVALLCLLVRDQELKPGLWILMSFQSYSVAGAQCE